MKQPKSASVSDTFLFSCRRSALYCIGYNQPGCYVTPEPLGPGGDPYPAMFGRPDPKRLDPLVRKTARYFRAREEEVLGL